MESHLLAEVLSDDYRGCLLKAECKEYLKSLQTVTRKAVLHSG